MHYARALVRSAQRQGLDSHALLGQAGLSPAVASQPQLRMTAWQFSQLLLYFWAKADDEFLGMASGASRHGTFTMMAKQAVMQPDLRAVLRHLARFYYLVSDAMKMELRENNGESHFILRLKVPDLDPDHMLVEFFLLLWHRFPSWLVGHKIPLLRVELAYPEPEHASGEYPLIYPCPALFDTPENSLVFPTEVLEDVVMQTPDTLKEHLKNAPLNWITQQTFSPLYTRRVMDRLQKSLSLGGLRMEDIAMALHMTSRTLRRKLTEEHTSFQQLKDRARRDEAIHQLSQPGMSVTKISSVLGFSDTAAFSRAFKGWTGVSPRAYRAGP